MICIRRRVCRNSFEGECQHIFSLEGHLAGGRFHEPENGLRPTVVFPQPDSPTRPNVSPWFRWKVTSSTALTQADTREKSPLRTGKYFFNPVTWSNGVVDSVISNDEFLKWDKGFFYNRIGHEDLFHHVSFLSYNQHTVSCDSPTCTVGGG